MDRGRGRCRRRRGGPLGALATDPARRRRRRRVHGEGEPRRKTVRHCRMCRFASINGRPHPPLPADWVAAFRGSRVEAQLQSDHVMFCPLDFPSQAGGFLDGMIRAQIDRLTPWTANDAVFGWSPPTTAANERIEVTFAATSKLKVEPLLQFVQCAGCASRSRFTPRLRRRARPPGSSCSTSRCEARIGSIDRTCRACCAPFCSRPVLPRRPRL